MAHCKACIYTGQHKENTQANVHETKRFLKLDLSFRVVEGIKLLRACKQCDGKFRTQNVGNTIHRNRDISVDVVISLNGREILVQILVGARENFLQY